MKILIMYGLRLIQYMIKSLYIKSLTFSPSCPDFLYKQIKVFWLKQRKKPNNAYFLIVFTEKCIYLSFIIEQKFVWTVLHLIGFKGTLASFAIV